MNRTRLEQLHPERFSSVLILADDAARVVPANVKSPHGSSIADADSRCLASLLLLRDIQSTRMPLTNKSMHACAPPLHCAGFVDAHTCVVRYSLFVPAESIMMCCNGRSGCLGSSNMTRHTHQMLQNAPL